MIPIKCNFRKRNCFRNIKDQKENACKCWGQTSIFSLPKKSFAILLFIYSEDVITDLIDIADLIAAAHFDENSSLTSIHYTSPSIPHASTFENLRNHKLCQQVNVEAESC